MEQRENNRNDADEMLGNDAENEANYRAEKRRYYRHLILTSIATFSICFIFGAFFEAFGLVGLLFGVFFFALGGLFFHIL